MSASLLKKSLVLFEENSKPIKKAALRLVRKGTLSADPDDASSQHENCPPLNNCEKIERRKIVQRGKALSVDAKQLTINVYLGLKASGCDPKQLVTKTAELTLLSFNTVSKLVRKGGHRNLQKHNKQAKKVQRLHKKKEELIKKNVEENLEKIKLLNRYSVSLDVQKKILDDTVKGGLPLQLAPKKQESTAFTEEDFQAFEKEYTGDD